MRLVGLVACILVLIAPNFAVPLPTKAVTQIAFGSCNAHNRDQSIWKSIVSAKPDLFVWLGDVVYADSPSLPLLWKSTPLNEMAAKFNAQKTSPLYSQLRSTTPIVGVWDDHDYGKNNGGSEYPDKVPSQTIFLDFIDEPTDSLRRKRSGIYTSYYLPGPTSDQEINLILLDVRFHKVGTMGQGDILGEEQWKWLEETLKASPSKIHLIGSGVQVTPFQKPVQEAWSAHLQSRQRLFDLITRLRVPGVILLSGDVHYSEVLKVPTECSGTGYPVYEFTSSGLTHSCDGALYNCKFFLDRFFHTPFHYGDSFFTGLNWGSIHFDWATNSIAFKTHNVNGDVVHEAIIDINTIQVPPQHDSSKLGALTICDGPPNVFLLIPFESYKILLWVPPLCILGLIIYLAYNCFRKVYGILNQKNGKKVKLGKTE